MGVLFRNNIIDLQLEDDDLQELKNQIYTEFGWSNVKVEITDQQFYHLIRIAVGYLNTYSPKVDYIFTPVKTTVSDYVIDKYDYVHSVQDVFVSATYLMGLGMPYQNLIGPAMTIGAAYDTTLLNDWVNLFAAYDLAKRMFGTQPQATLIQPNIVRLDPIPYMDTTFCFVVTVNHDRNLASLSQYELDWFLRYMKAVVGKTVGETRRKYDGVQLPVGTLSNSGSAMYTENLEREKELIEEIRARHKLPAAYISLG